MAIKNKWGGRSEGTPDPVESPTQPRNPKGSGTNKPSSQDVAGSFKDELGKYISDPNAFLDTYNQYLEVAGDDNEINDVTGVAMNLLKDQLKNNGINDDDYYSTAGQLINNLIDKQQGRGYLEKYASARSTVNKYKDIAIQNEAMTQLGRRLDESELARARPSFKADDAFETGRGWLATYVEQQKNTPNELAKRAPQFSDQVKGMFQTYMGRDPNAEELNYYGSALASGQTDSYTLSNLLKNTPEYQQGQDVKFRQGLVGEMEPLEADVMNKGREQLIADYASRGINAGTSPALDFAITNMLGEVAKNRSGFLTNLSAQQYGSNKQAAAGDYQNMLANYLNNANQARQQNQSNMNTLLGRGWEISDYNRQSQDYMSYLNSQKQKGMPSWYPIASLALNGANTAAQFYNPTR